MNDIQKAIELLSNHNYRSVSNVVGEYVEKLVTSATHGEQAQHCQKGFDIYSEKYGKIEVKARNLFAKSKRCTLAEKKLSVLDNFLLVIVEKANIHKALLFNKEALLSIRSKSGKVYVDEQHYKMAKDITQSIRNAMALPIVK